MTHMNYAPGEQKHRNYEWKFDPNGHVFGYAEKKVANGAAMALQAERPEEMFPKTVIVKKTVEDHKAVAGDLLGKTKNLGQGQTDRGPDFVHGIKNLTSTDIWNAGHCIHGEPGQRELNPDADLGRSSKPGTRNVVRSEKDLDRSFGLPTIRNDIPYKAFRSVANYQNFGDEPEAVDLLFPSSFNEVGVNEQEFRNPRTRD
jgi:EF-hand domain-containing family member B